MVNGRLGQSCAPAEVLAAASAARAAMILMLGMTVSPRSITRPRWRSEDRHPAGRVNVMAGQKASCNRVFKRAASSFAPTIDSGSDRATSCLKRAATQKRTPSVGGAEGTFVRPTKIDAAHPTDTWAAQDFRSAKGLFFLL